MGEPKTEPVQRTWSSSAWKRRGWKTASRRPPAGELRGRKRKGYVRSREPTATHCGCGMLRNPCRTAKREKKRSKLTFVGKVGMYVGESEHPVGFLGCEMDVANSPLYVWSSNGPAASLEAWKCFGIFWMAECCQTFSQPPIVSWCPYLL